MDEIASHPSMDDYHNLNNRKMIILNIASQTQIEFETDYVPERGLLMAVLERAVRDLGKTGARVDRMTAIKWFRDRRELKDTEMVGGFSYEYVSATLGLNLSQRNYIDALVDQAEDLQAKIIKAQKCTITL